jgi:hypothetical protein
MYKFFGEPLKEIKSKQTGKVIFRFDTKGEHITDDEEIIKRALGFFDYIKLKSETVGTKVKKTVEAPKMTIETTKMDDEIKVGTRKCKKCDFTTDSQGELLQHYRTHKEG